jgi:hypothetical protein
MGRPSGWGGQKQIPSLRYGMTTKKAWNESQGWG